jgi:hypothetical protein
MRAREAELSMGAPGAPSSAQKHTTWVGPCISLIESYRSLQRSFSQEKYFDATESSMRSLHLTVRHVQKRAHQAPAWAFVALCPARLRSSRIHPSFAASSIYPTEWGQSLSSPTEKYLPMGSLFASSMSFSFTVPIAACFSDRSSIMDSTPTPSVTNGVIWSVFVRSTHARSSPAESKRNVKLETSRPGTNLVERVEYMHDSPLDLTGYCFSLVIVFTNCKCRFSKLDY